MVKKMHFVDYLQAPVHRHNENSMRFDPWHNKNKKKEDALASSQISHVV